jgi:hypothetical protein
VWTRASQGVLHGINGFQDLTLAAKFSAFERPSANVRTVRAIGVLSVSIPLTDSNPELPPLSIGSGSTRVSPRGTLNYQSGQGLYLDGSAAYTWRMPVTLDATSIAEPERILRSPTSGPTVPVRPRRPATGTFLRSPTSARPDSAKSGPRAPSRC